MSTKGLTKPLKQRRRPTATEPPRRATTGERVGGRSAEVVARVLRVTLEELGRVGYAALRIETVAARSAVNKTTIYRRWPTKIELIGAACRALKANPKLNHTGNLERDLCEAYALGVRAVDTPVARGVIRMMQTEAMDPAVAQMTRELRAAAWAPRRARLRAAIADGELPAHADIELIQMILSGAIYGRAMRYDERVTDEYIADVVALVLAGARAGRGAG